MTRVRAIGCIYTALTPAVDQLNRVEIAGDGRLGLLVGGVDQPHDEEEAHHGSHEIGEGDLPDTTVVSLVVIVVAAPHDDDLVRGFTGLGSWNAKAPNPPVTVTTTTWTPARDAWRYESVRFDMKF